MNTPRAAEAFPAGEILGDELEARGWSQADFAEVLDRPTQFVSEIISGKKEITRESAAQLGAALGTSAEFWLNLQDSYLLWKQAQDEHVQENLDGVRTRARLRELAPLTLLKRRGFITADDPAGETAQILSLFGMRSLDDEAGIRFAARRTNVDEPVTMLQTAWVACIKASAVNVGASRYSHPDLEALARRLAAQSREPQAFREFQAAFAEVGVKLIYVEAFPGAKLDGCALIDGGTPVIGVSGRGKRLDKVLFTILHEVAHVLLDHLTPDGDAIVDDLSARGHDREAEADHLAAELAIPAPLTDVPQRLSRRWIETRALELGVPPIVLIGRLQNDHALSWDSSLVRGAPTVTEQLQSWVGTPVP